jgi:hypothetical protein
MSLCLYSTVPQHRRLMTLIEHEDIQPLSLRILMFQKRKIDERAMPDQQDGCPSPPLLMNKLPESRSPRRQGVVRKLKSVRASYW